jgi:uncharacterized protein (DUF433 family)
VNPRIKPIAIESATLEECVENARHERIVITRNGVPVALMVGVEGLDEEQIESAGSDERFTRPNPEAPMQAVIIDRGRGPEIAGTRITVYDILDYYMMNWHHTAIAATLRLSSAQVLAAIRYIEEHRDEVMPEYQKMLERDARGNPPELQAKLDATYEKYKALWAERRRARAAEAENDGNPCGQ